MQCNDYSVIYVEFGIFHVDRNNIRMAQAYNERISNNKLV